MIDSGRLCVVAMMMIFGALENIMHPPGGFFAAK